MAIKITDFGGTDWTDGNILYSDDLIETIKQTSYVKANGVIVVNNVAYGNQFVDISFTSGELGINDTIIIEVLPFVLPSASSSAFIKPIINDVTSPQDLGEMALVAGDTEICSALQIISSDTTTTNFVLYRYETLVNVTLTSKAAKSGDTSESNPLTTAFTLRLDTKKVTNNSTIRYRIIIQRGRN